MVSAMECKASVLGSIDSSSDLIRVHYVDWQHALLNSGHYGLGGVFMSLKIDICAAAQYSDQAS